LLLQILGPLTPVMYLDSVATGMLKGINEQVHSLWYSVADSAVRITLIWLLLPRFGITGFLFVMLVSNLLTCILSTHRLLVKSETNMRWMRWILCPTLISFLVGGGWSALTQVIHLSSGWTSLMAGIAFVSIAYIMLLPLFGCLTIEDMKALTRRRHA
jgi:stage V sporulation protein B